MKILRSLFGLLMIFLFALPAFSSGNSENENKRYRIAACDWMMLKRQKLGEFKLSKDIHADGVEMDVGGLGKRDTFDNKFHQAHFRELFRRTSDSLQIPVPSVAMSGFYGQSFLTHKNYKALVEDCLSTMRVMGAKVAFLPLGGIKEDWTKPGPARDELVKRLHVAGTMADADGAVIGIRTPLSAKENKRLLREINSPGVKIYYSVQSAIEQGLNVPKDIRKLGNDNICQIHISNTDGFTLDKDPAVDLPAIKRVLDGMGWSGWLVVERSRDAKDVRNVKGNFGKNVAHLKEVFQND